MILNILNGIGAIAFLYWAIFSIRENYTYDRIDLIFISCLISLALLLIANIIY